MLSPVKSIKEKSQNFEKVINYRATQVQNLSLKVPTIKIKNEKNYNLKERFYEEDEIADFKVMH